jgi:hypothetical protein
MEEKMRLGVIYFIGLVCAIFGMGCSSAPTITMLDVATPISEQSRIMLTNSVTVISIDGDSPYTTATNSYYNTYTDEFYIPSGKHTITVNWKSSYSSLPTVYHGYYETTYTTTVVTVTADNIQFTDDFSPGHTYAFRLLRYDDNYIVVLEDASQGNLVSPEIAPNAPKSGRVTNWDYPVNNSYLALFTGGGFDVGYSNIKHPYEHEEVIVWPNVTEKKTDYYGEFDISAQFFLQGGLGLGWKNWGISIIPEIGGGFGSFYTVQWHYALLADVYFGKWNFDFGWGQFQGGSSAFRDINNVPTPFLRGMISIKRPSLKDFYFGGYFDYYYENSSLGFGLRIVLDDKGFPTIVRKTLN